MSEANLVTSELRGHVLMIGLNRPGKLNSFNLQMLRELSAAYTRYQGDTELWCALLFAHGKNFTSGLDLSEVGPEVAAGRPLFPEASVDPPRLARPGAHTDDAREGLESFVEGRDAVFRGR